MNYPPWTERQKLFVHHYLVTGVATEAAKLAGYSARTAYQQGYRLLHSPDYKYVQEEIARRQREMSEKLKVDAEWVLRELVEAVEVAKASVRPKLNSKTGKPIRDEDGNPVYTRNDAALLKALELIGKHLSVGAFRDVVKVEAEDRLIAALHAGRERVRRDSNDV
jgi:phage terminase small subunit